MQSLAKVHPSGQALTLIAKKYDLPEEVEKNIMDRVFSNKLPESPMRYRNFWDAICQSLAHMRNYSNYGSKCLGWILYSKYVLSYHHPMLKHLPHFELDRRVNICGLSRFPIVLELKTILKELIKYNKLKIHISKLRKQELISLLIHTEF
eukprot:SAG11_NODE_2125_length_3782_cov_22.707847_2_plen_150_part_00